jgi:quercetin dioxygenase-like cupin family protein
MKKIIAAAFAVTLALAAFAPHAVAVDGKQGAAAVLVPTNDVKWKDLPGFKGAQMAVLEGNPAKGPHHSMLKFVGGFTAPLHHHSSDHYGTVVAGTLLLTVDGKDKKLPAGSYFSFKGQNRERSGLCSFVYGIDTIGIKGEVIVDLGNSRVRSLISPYGVG